MDKRRENAPLGGEGERGGGEKEREGERDWLIKVISYKLLQFVIVVNTLSVPSIIICLTMKSLWMWIVQIHQKEHTTLVSNN